MDMPFANNQGVNQNAGAVPPAPGRKFPDLTKIPKNFLIIGGAIILVLIVFFIIKSILGKSSQTSGSITWWGLWEDTSLVDPVIKEYEAANPGVKITYIKQSPTDYRERLLNALAKGQGPDIFMFHNSWVPMFKNQLDSLPASVMSPSEYAKTFYPIASSDLTLGTGIVGIPLEYDGLALYVNTEIFDKAGKTPPTTWDDLRQTARELTVKDGQGIITQSGVALGRADNVDHWQEVLALMMLQNGVDLSNPTGKQAEDALTFFSLFSTVDGVWDASLPPSTSMFAAGKLAMYFAPSWRTFEIQQSNPTLKFKTVPVPQLPKDSPSQPDITYATYWAQGVWTRSGRKSAAWNFLKFLSTKSTLTKLYKNQSAVRQFGEPYPRVDMSDLLATDPMVGSLLKQAPGATSWYLASRTFDGPTGINSLLSKYFEDAINAVTAGQDVSKSLDTAAAGVKQVLSQYGIVAK